ncbi:MAG: hypothetical protein GX823_02850 [Clostridiales bacterium]|nr:hypothetical protein [Clostridiales bacterium]
MFKCYGRPGCGTCIGTALLCGGIILLSIAFLPATCWLFIIGLAMALEGFWLLRKKCRW